ncbi:MAG: hypothetical protein ACK4ZI_23255 [Microcystis sp.]|jgi:hypothetical protein|uniref:Uncharacterized protein n=1 Tax=Microcystis viridis NIES-102 TaxID=213615 RepID=A0A3G9JQH0_MICVR|nr:hypothetical protein [Microcystis viridis]BBH37767.1 hypothetical protein myaer102_02280 [Microcystis viridis NIES-102]
MPDENSFEELINELKLRNIKHNSQDIIAITQLDNGRIIFLEIGNSSSGWEHILNKHGEDFQRRGIAINNIIDFLMKAITMGQLIGTQGTSRSIYKVDYQGEIQYISIDIGSNGYVVSANLTPRKLIQRFLGEDLDEKKN